MLSNSVLNVFEAQQASNVGVEQRIREKLKLITCNNPTDCLPVLQNFTANYRHQQKKFPDYSLRKTATDQETVHCDLEDRYRSTSQVCY